LFFIYDRSKLDWNRYVGNDIKIPLVHDGDDTAAVDTDLLKCRLRHVEVRAMLIAPTPLGQRHVGRAEVCGRDGHRDTRFTEHRVSSLAVTGDFVALPARGAVVEEDRAQRRRPRTIALGVEVPIPARAACHQYIIRSDDDVCDIVGQHTASLPMVSEASAPP